MTSQEMRKKAMAKRAEADDLYHRAGVAACDASKLMQEAHVAEMAENAAVPVDRTNVTLTDGSPVTPDHKEIQPSGMQKGYVVLSEEERAKGFVRPVRRSYQHVGIPGPKHSLSDLTPVQLARYAALNYVKFEAYPEGGSTVGRYWTQEMLDKVGKGCGYVTTMGVALAETYARDPKFYGGTFCSHCGGHFPVGEYGEFVWDGTNERVGV